MSRVRATTAGFAALLAASLIALGGCAVTKTSKIDDYQVEAESLATSIAAMAPADAEVLPWDSAMATGGGVPDSDVWWQVTQAINTAEGTPNGAEAAGLAITEGLEADGWDGKKLGRSDETRAVFGFNRADSEGDKWYIELRYRLGETARGVDFLVVSPPTDAP